MLYIWILILAGVILVPIISGATKEMEKRMEKVDKKDKQKKEDMKFIIKLLTYAAIALFIVIVIIMARFTSNIIYSN